MNSQFICIKCNSSLIEKEDYFLCESCKDRWNKRNGIPTFLKEKFYWGEVPQDLMNKINHEIVKKNWREVVEENLSKDYQSIIKYIDDDSRADFRVLLPIGKKSTILDVGCGWGSLTIPLAKFYDKVLAFDGIEERVEFVNHRIRQEGLQNVQLFTADFNEIPLPEASVDAVIINGILEWVAVNSSIDNPKEAQCDFLKKIFKILKPGGCIYIGIENRIGYPYFFGMIDHSGFKYTSLMPRKIANWYIKIIKGSQKTESYRTAQSNYRVYTYTSNGYKRLITQAGFSEIKINTPITTYNDFRQIVSLNNIKTLIYYVQNVTRGISKKKRLFRLIIGNRIGAFLFQKMTYCFSIIAVKGVSK